MVRPIWTGSISFGLVAVPVKAVPVQSPKDIRFELVHRDCHTKLVTKRFCPACNREVSDEETVRGFRYSKNEYVLVDQEELDAVESPAKHTLRILDFVAMRDVDPVYFEKPYFLQPAPGGERTYLLLHRAMSDAGRVAVGKVALREREHLALIRPMKHALVMETIAFPDEVRSVDEVVTPVDGKIDERELKMAEYLIEAMTGRFEPAKYQDDYRETLRRIIETKVEGGTVQAKPAAKPIKGEVVDLMEMLRRSVEAAQGPADAPREEQPAPAAEPEQVPGPELETETDERHRPARKRSTARIKKAA